MPTYRNGEPMRPIDIKLTKKGLRALHIKDWTADELKKIGLTDTKPETVRKWAEENEDAILKQFSDLQEKARAGDPKAIAILTEWDEEQP